MLQSPELCSTGTRAHVLLSCFAHQTAAGPASFFCIMPRPPCLTAALCTCLHLGRKSINRSGPGFGYGFVLAYCFTLAFFCLLCSLVLDGFSETVTTTLENKNSECCLPLCLPACPAACPTRPPCLHALPACSALPALPACLPAPGGVCLCPFAALICCSFVCCLPCVAACSRHGFMDAQANSRRQNLLAQL